MTEPTNQPANAPSNHPDAPVQPATASRIKKAAETAILSCLAIKKGEKLLIVSNPDTEQAQIAEALHAVALEHEIQSKLVYQPVKTQADFAEPYVIEALAAKPDAVISISTEKMGKDRESLQHPRLAPNGKSYDHIFDYLMYGTKEMRSFWSPHVTLDMFSRTVDIDYRLMRKRAAILKSLLDQASAIMIRAPGGTDICLGIEGRETFIDDGDFGEKGKGGNLPAGEVFISPALKSGDGHIVFDGSIADIAGDIVIKEPIDCTVSGGFVMEAKDSAEAEQLEKAMQHGMEMASRMSREGKMAPEEALRYATNARHLGELGIGLNAMAKIGGNMLEDEKVYGTCHFAIGANYDDDAPALIHLDGLVRRPTMTALFPAGNELTFMRDGSLIEDLFPSGN
ncbi:MAG: aminopeptidase [Spirochaetaceae bacterium]|nr:aminopeptidase [Spirochaetaceae bacterium]